MEESMVEMFDNNDDLYQKWLAENPDGFVINTTRDYSKDYMVLHKATCSSISKYTNMAQPGGFTERRYIKICSDTIEDLENWVRKQGAITFTKECGKCAPR